MPWHSTAIANEFLKRAKKEGHTLTQMQLQKLVYIAHGWNLAINGEPLTIDRPQAWDYGPVYSELWDALRHYGRSPVTEPIKIGDYVAGMFRENADEEARASLSKDEKELIDTVYETYGKFDAYQLSALTHQEGTPWDSVFSQGHRKGEIRDELIRKHFVDLGREGRRAS